MCMYMYTIFPGSSKLGVISSTCSIAVSWNRKKNTPIVPTSIQQPTAKIHVYTAAHRLSNAELWYLLLASFPDSLAPERKYAGRAWERGKQWEPGNEASNESLGTRLASESLGTRLPVPLTEHSKLLLTSSRPALNLSAILPQNRQDYNFSTAGLVQLQLLTKSSLSLDK